jgi:hypothetical protein
MEYENCFVILKFPSSAIIGILITPPEVTVLSAVTLIVIFVEVLALEGDGDTVIPLG